MSDVAHVFLRKYMIMLGLALCQLCTIAGVLLFWIQGSQPIPFNIEWPVGYAQNVVTTTDRMHFVPLPTSGRIQVYAPDWQFLRAINVDSRGGDFKIVRVDEQSRQIQVQSARAHDTETYAFDGALQSREALNVEYGFSSPTGQATWVTTPFWKLPAAGPINSWLLAAAGLGGSFLLRRELKRLKEEKRVSLS